VLTKVSHRWLFLKVHPAAGIFRQMTCRVSGLSVFPAC
jgi:hypothetical protein